MWILRITQLALISFSLQWLRFVSAFPKPNSSPQRGSILSPSMAHEFSAEVVGASGRMGTFWLERHACDNKSNVTIIESAVACPRGTTPGSQTPEGCPIYVATPSDAYLPIYEATPPSRRRDLVLVGNAGLPIDERFGECTILVPHFSVLYQDQWKGNKSESISKTGKQQSSRKIQVNTDRLVSPPTCIYGKHSEMVASVLEANGIASKVVPSFREIKAYSGRKLVWASCFWLLCHSYDGGDSKKQSNSQPLTVGQVHKFRQIDLEKLVDEILPSLRNWLLSEDDNDGDDERKITDDIGRIIDRTRVLDYLRAYSESISGAVPSVALAKQEFRDRNGVWLSNHRHKQPFHTELLTKVGIDIGSLALSED
mmetsp:Transcript_11845/g.30036  ORF Transcript_11845/g.30036 Transcript_11845/m.30036 type:complete len:369 (+) Transcript_11845:275-1381(+)|eukprot:CAMPEP_0116092240 /NCGR_PEP_ID=MMETSP0327-20121206/7937_1 /TAXON_ID=44447 /ORGANISM="Pseudo-nitzschia delicatissima, Strain B596" /LENGTH=368 /DNA_ID=CAMNT_0003583653 /DNA_START=239 /DNA_END=1345 /DNA_ORIENTATION=+